MATTPATAVRWSLALALAASSLACHPPRSAVAVHPSPPEESAPPVIVWQGSPEVLYPRREEERPVEPVLPEGYLTVPTGLLEPVREFLRHHPRLYHIVANNRGTRCEALTFQPLNPDTGDGEAVSDPYEHNEDGLIQEIRSLSPYRIDRVEYGWMDVRTREEHRYDQVSLALRGPIDQRLEEHGRIDRPPSDWSWSTFRSFRCESQAAIVAVETEALVFIPGGGLIRGYHPSTAQRLFTEAAACLASLPVAHRRRMAPGQAGVHINLGCTVGHWRPPQLL
jgi:hypothetical protein